MAIYHLTVNISNCACDSIAYGLRTKIVDNITNEIHDRRGKDLKNWGVALCENAPENWKDPQKLCDAIVQIEKQKDAQQCRTFEGSLPSDKGVTDEDREKIVRQFVGGLKKQGMCVVWAIHNPDKENPNPHFHAYATMRSVDKQGNFMAKCKKVYETEEVLDENGQKVIQKVGIYDKNGNIKTDKAGRKQYKCHRENLNTWNDTETLQMWRKGFELIQNQVFKRKGIDASVSCETLAEQGIDRIPQIHIPRKSWEIMKQGKSDPFVERYNQIREMNDAKEKQEELNTRIASLEEEIKELDEYIDEQTMLSEKEKSSIENAQISHESGAEGYTSPFGAELALQSSAGAKQEEKGTRSFAVLFIRDTWNKITGYLDRVCLLLDPVIAEEKPTDMVEENEEYIDTYRFFDNEKEAIQAFYEAEEEAKEYNDKITSKQTQAGKETARNASHDTEWER